MIDAWVLDRPGPGAPSTEYSTVDGNMRSARRCLECKRYLGLLRWAKPFRVDLDGTGPGFADVAFGNTNDLLASPILADAFKSGQLRGAKVLGLAATGRITWRGQPPNGRPRYGVLRVLRVPDAINDRASGIVREDGPPCPVCRQAGVMTRLERVVFESTTYLRKLDLAVIRGLPGIVCCSQEFVALANEVRMKGFVLIPARDFKISY